MGITLYKPGNTHVIDGIKCTMETFNSELFNGLPKGWFFSPHKMTEAKNPKKKSLEEISIREQAKELGIQNWHTKKIDRLETEIKEKSTQGDSPTEQGE